MAAIGSILDDKYEILALVGEGGMSKVYLARDNKLNRHLAIKKVVKNSHDKNNAIIIQSAIVEANILKNLSHVGLTYIVDIIETPHEIFIVMEYVEGKSLDELLTEQGPQPQDSVVEWAKQLCVVLQYLHTREPPIIYRDMKPANIRLRPDGTLKLIDFGIAREYKEQNLTDTISLGTRGYAAPEQFAGQGQTDARTDIYCIGVTLYHLLTGHSPSDPPYELHPIREFNPSLSTALERIIQKCTQLNPNDRYQSCTQLLTALENYKQMDDDFLLLQKQKLYRFLSVAGASLICIIIGILALFIRTSALQKEYSNYLQIAGKATSDAEKAHYYLQAVDLKPDEPDAYFHLIDTFKHDAVFTTTEEMQLKKRINAHLPILKSSPSYPDIAFEIGKLYWYYFDYGKSEQTDNQITRIKSSIQWFEDTVLYGSERSSYYKMALIYRDIGRFNRDIILNIAEASDQWLYAPYFNNMKESISLIQNTSEQNELIPLELYQLIISSIETYARKFKADGITQREVQSLFDQAKQGTLQTDVTTEKTDDIKQRIIGRFEPTQKAIDNAYAD